MDRTESPSDIDREEAERCGTIAAWAKHLGFSFAAIQRRLVHVEGMTGLDSSGKLRLASFYPESIVREQCADLLLVESVESHQTDPTELEYASLSTLSDQLGVSRPTLKKYLQEEEGVRMKNRGGQICMHYPVALARQKCEHLLNEAISAAGEDGFFERNGERYGTVGAWANVFAIHPETVAKRLSGSESVKGKDAMNREARFYSYQTVLQTFEHRTSVHTMPKVNDAGFVQQHGEIFGTCYAWARKMNLTYDCVRTMAQGCNPIVGIGANGHVCHLFPESMVRKAYSDRPRNLPEADQNGFFLESGERYGTRTAWARELRVDYRMISKRLSSINGKTGKSSSGNVQQFFAESQVRDALKK